MIERRRARPLSLRIDESRGDDSASVRLKADEFRVPGGRLSDVETGSPAEVMRAMIQMFASGELGPVTSTVAEQYVDHQGLGDGEIRGTEGFVHVVHTARRGYLELDVWAEDVIVEGNRAVARIRWRGTLGNGDRVERETIDILRARKGELSSTGAVSVGRALGMKGREVEP